jgi:hypothetical protein
VSKRICTMLAVVVALAAVAAGCGGGDGGDDEALTKAQFIKQADKICKRISEKNKAELQAFVQKVQGEGGLENSGADLGRQVMLPNFETKVEELNDLGAPNEGEAQITAWFEALEDTAEEAQRDPNILIGFAASADSPLVKANRIAREYGFEECDFA